MSEKCNFTVGENTGINASVNLSDRESLLFEKSLRGELTLEDLQNERKLKKEAFTIIKGGKGTKCIESK